MAIDAVLTNFLIIGEAPQKPASGVAYTALRS